MKTREGNDSGLRICMGRNALLNLIFIPKFLYLKFIAVFGMSFSVAFIGFGFLP